MTTDHDTQALDTAFRALNRPLGRTLIKQKAHFQAWAGVADLVWLVDGRGDPIKASKGTRPRTKECQRLFEALKPFLEDFYVGQGEIGYRISARLLAEHRQQQMDRHLSKLDDTNLNSTPNRMRGSRF